VKIIGVRALDREKEISYSLLNLQRTNREREREREEKRNPFVFSNKLMMEMSGI